MAGFPGLIPSREDRAVLEALDKSQAIIEFAPDGTVITANRNFLQAMGYSLAEVKGRHHRMFVDPAYAASPDYTAFWAKLRRGEFAAATSSVAARTIARSGSRRLTIPFWGGTASRSKW